MDPNTKHLRDYAKRLQLSCKIKERRMHVLQQLLRELHISLEAFVDTPLINDAVRYALDKITEQGVVDQELPPHVRCTLCGNVRLVHGDKCALCARDCELAEKERQLLLLATTIKSLRNNLQPAEN